MSLWYDVKNKKYASNGTSNWIKSFVERKFEEKAAILNTAVDTKVDKVTGKALSTNDFTNAYKSKLDGIEAGAEQNSVTSVAGKTGSVTLAKSDVGLSNVNNTSDADKPISTATQTALNGKLNSSNPSGSGCLSMNRSGDPQFYGIKSSVIGNENGSEGFSAFAAGYKTHADGRCSFTSGEYLIAKGAHQNVFGRYNDIFDSEESQAYVIIVGNGSPDELSNAHTLDWDGNAWFAGDIRIGGTGYADGKKIGEWDTTEIPSSTHSCSLTMDNADKCVTHASGTLSSLTFTVTNMQNIGHNFETRLVFSSPASSAPTVTASSTYFTFIGDDCNDSGVFTPVAGGKYEISFARCLNKIVARVGAF